MVIDSPLSGVIPCTVVCSAKELPLTQRDPPLVAMRPSPRAMSSLVIVVVDVSFQSQRAGVVEYDGYTPL
jgi:hypothetical protein